MNVNHIQWLCIFKPAPQRTSCKGYCSFYFLSLPFFSLKLTSGHLSEENRLQLDDWTQHLLAFLSGDVAFALTLQKHLIILLLKQDQQVWQQHTMHIWKHTHTNWMSNRPCIWTHICQLWIWCLCWVCGYRSLSLWSPSMSEVLQTASFGWSDQWSDEHRKRIDIISVSPLTT